ncbi:MAG: hypothetical protein ABUS49_02640 [Acidobacteriota bacterium]
MKPKLIALNLILALAVCATVWQARVRWLRAQAERRATLHVPVPAPKPPAVPPAAKLEPPPATKYAEVAEKNLFSSDRNPTVIIDPPKPPEEKKMPRLPVVYGTMGLPSGLKAIMAEKPGDASRPVGAGDTIGEFKVLTLDPQKVTFGWDGKEIARRIEDLIDRSNTEVASNRGASPRPSGPAAPPPPPVQAQPSGDPRGAELTPTMRADRPGDTSPPGTVVDGYKKVVTPSPFGNITRWIKQ